MRDSVGAGVGVGPVGVLPPQADRPRHAAKRMIVPRRVKPLYLSVALDAERPSRSQRLPSISKNTATCPYGSTRGAVTNLTPAATIRACEQNAGATTDGANNDPAFRATVIRQRRNVLHELELQDIHKDIDRRLVLSHQGDELEV